MELALVAARAVHFSACAVLFGGAGLALTLRRRQGRVDGALRLAAATAALSGVAWFAVVFLDVTGGSIDKDMWAAFFGAPFGIPWLVRLVLCVAAAILAVRCGRSLAVALGAAFVIDQAWLGHAATSAGDAAVAQVLFYWMHVAAGFAWIGALVMLCVISIDEKRVPRDGLALFAAIGPFVVATILASGIVNASFRGIGVAGLLTTPYGRVLTVKLGLFAAMVALAVRNRVSRRGNLQVFVAVETACGVAVIAVAALLGVTSPP